jgi:hypothetical protein
MKETDLAMLTSFPKEEIAPAILTFLHVDEMEPKESE